MSTVFVTLTDSGYYPKALKTIEQLRTRGQWSGEIVLICVACEPPQDDITKHSLTIRKIAHIDHTPLWEIWKQFPLPAMQDNRHYGKVTQWDKLDVFAEYFQKWDRVVFIDAGMYIINPVEPLLKLPWEGRFLAPDDADPLDNGNRFRCQVHLDKNLKVKEDFIAEFGTKILDRRYFLNCIFVYDTRLLKARNPEIMKQWMCKFPVMACNEMGIMNLFFKDLWVPFPLTVKISDTQKYLFAWSEMSYKHCPNASEFCFLKYPGQPGLLQDKENKDNLANKQDNLPNKRVKIGIATPCYKRHLPLLKRFLDSVEAQTVKPYHVVISCSSTKTAELPKLQRYTFPIKFVTHEKRLNAAQNRNIAADILLGLGSTHLSFFDCDDVMHPQRLEAIQKAFLLFPAPKIVLHSYSTTEAEVKEDFKLYETFDFVSNHLQRSSTGCALLRTNELARIHHSQVSIVKRIFEQVRFMETKPYERKEDAIFCGDALKLGIPNIYIRNSLSKYYPEGQWYEDSKSDQKKES
jgi:hypothetical protein